MSFLFREPEFTAISRTIWWVLFCFFAGQPLSTMLLCVGDIASDYGVGCSHKSAVECDLHGKLVQLLQSWGRVGGGDAPFVGCDLIGLWVHGRGAVGIRLGRPEG